MPRYRNKQIKFRTTDDEYKEICKNAKHCGFYNLSDYLRSVAIDMKIINIDYSSVRELSKQIRKVGVNINQIAKKLNQTNQLSENDWKALQRCLDDIKSIARDHKEQNKKFRKEL